METTGLRSRSASADPDFTERTGPPEEAQPQAAKEVPPPPSSAGPEASSGSFECNICLETPNDPVVTLCGHLFCWACLYRWLRGHAHTNECPVCKAGVEEDKVVPLYGRGKASSDPRKRPVPGAEVPSRPTGRRAEPTRHARPEPAFGFFPSVGGPFASAQIGGFTVSAGFGLFPALFGWNFHGSPGFTHGMMPGAFGLGTSQQPMARNAAAEEQNALLSKLLFVLGIFVMLAIIFS